MDFSKQLASLQQTASRAQQQGRRGGGGETSRGGSGGGDRDYRDRDRDNRYSSSHHNNRRGRGRGHNHGRYRRDRDPYPHHSSGRNRQQMTDAEEEFYLPKLIQAIPKYQPLPPKRKKKQRHVCLLFLTIDDLPLEHIWRAFLEHNHHHRRHDDNDDNNKHKNDPNVIVSVICHAKFPEKVTSPWLKQRMLVHKPPLRDIAQYKDRYAHLPADQQDGLLPPVRYFSRKPEWGSVEITRAMIDLVDEGLRTGTSRDNTVSIANGIKDPAQSEAYRKRYSSRRYIATTHEDDSSNWNSKEPLPTVDRFIFVSETCLPVTTLSEFESALFRDEDDPPRHHQEGKKQPSNTHTTITTNEETCYDQSGANKSWINARNTPNNGYARQLQWDATDSSIPRNKIWKADQWIVLTRHHAWPIISLIDDAIQSVQSQIGGGSGGGGNRDRDRGGHHRQSRIQLALWQCFRRVKASDEMYFPTVMALLGILEGDDEENESASAGVGTDVDGADKKPMMKEEVCNRRVTYCDWSMNAKNPASFVINRQDKFKELIRVVRLARQERCLFARKFTTSEGPGSAFGSSMRQEDSGNDDETAITGDEWMEIIRKLQ